jgi:hypothetical protein
LSEFEDGGSGGDSGQRCSGGHLADSHYALAEAGGGFLRGFDSGRHLVGTLGHGQHGPGEAILDGELGKDCE